MCLPVSSSGTIQQTNIQQESEEISTVDLFGCYPYLYNTPRDGNCLYWSFLFSIFLPIRDNEAEVREKFLKIFGEDNIPHLDVFTLLIRSYDGEGVITTPFECLGISGFIISYLRFRLAEYVESNREKFISFLNEGESIEDYIINSLTKVGTWAGEREIFTLSECFQYPIFLVSSKLLKPTHYGASFYDENLSLCFEHVAGNHYQFRVEREIVMPPVIRSARGGYGSASSLPPLPPTWDELEKQAAEEPLPELIKRLKSNLVNYEENCREGDPVEVNFLRGKISEQLSSIIHIDKLDEESDGDLSMYHEVISACIRKIYPNCFHKIAIMLEKFCLGCAKMRQTDYLPTCNSKLLDTTLAMAGQISQCIGELSFVVIKIFFDQFVEESIQTNVNCEAINKLLTSMKAQLSQENDEERSLLKLLEYMEIKIKSMLVLNLTWIEGEG